MENIKLFACNIAENINLKQLKNNIPAKLIISSSSELFYYIDENKYISIFNFGVVAFSNHTQQEIDQFYVFIENYISDRQDKISEAITIEFDGSNEINIKNDILTVPLAYKSNELIRIVMFDLSQTLAIEYYSKIGESLLEDLRMFSIDLEYKGKIMLSRKNMMKFIGKSLNTKNKIIENLYIFHTPDIICDIQEVEKVHKSLIVFYDLKSRFKELEYTFNVIDDNLQIFKETSEHRYSSKLEIVVIILILIEVLKSLGEKFKFF
ncbi:MAG: RMD1 family protein [Bacteroidota bacterium]